MKNIRLLMEGETLFRDENVFSPSYVPADFMHRDPELEEITLSLKPGLRGMSPINTLIYGPPATGKTTAARYVFEKLSETTKKLLPVYISCEDFSTPYSIFARIYTAVYGISPPSTGKPLEDVKERIFSKLRKDNRSLVIALDELDRLVLERNIDRVLIDLLKAHATYGYDKVGVIGITIKEDVLAGLDEKTRSVYNPTRIEFKTYSRAETRDILENRVKHGLYDGVLGEEMLDYIVDKADEARDLRTGIELIRRSALLAEKDASRAIKKEHIDRAYEALPRQRNEEAEGKLSDDDKTLLGLIKDEPGRNSGHYFMLFREKTGSGVKRYNESIARLEREKLIKTGYRQGARGRSREIRPA